jgi:hypothetical protein
MAGMTERATASALDLARAVRPGRYGKVDKKHIVDPVIEPMWSGLRLIGAVDRGQALLLDEGEPLIGRDELATALAESTAGRADTVIVDGFLTRQIVSDVATTAELVELPTAREFLKQGMVGARSNPTKDATKRIAADFEAKTFAPGELLNVVVIDILHLDGEWLLDVPLLERKRLLEAVVAAGELVRPSPYVRPPVDTWLGSWRAQGFTGITYKAANSHYRPGEQNPDWTTTPMPKR